MLDGNLSTFWYSNWPYSIATSGPHIINVDMGESKTFHGIYTYSKRSVNLQFRPKHVVVEVSNDGINYTQAKDFYSDALEHVALKIAFGNNVTARYMRLKVDQIYTNPGYADNLVINELDILQ